MRQGHTRASTVAAVDAGAEVDRDAIEAAVRQILVAIGEDADRTGLVDTPARVARMYEEILGGENFTPTVFPNPGYDEMLVERDIPFYSLCEHHLLPFFGVAHVGYVPADRVIGLSKIARLIRARAARLQIQERLTAEIADGLDRLLAPVGVGVVIEAEHLCMTMRGVRSPGTVTVTSSLRGCLKEKPEARAEFFAICRDGRKR
jgi:GTP cyclohydrolase I